MILNNSVYFYTECKPIIGYLNPGFYHIEAWGGGNAQLSKGGYASGYLKLYKKTKCFINIGSTTIEGNPSFGGCNGGGTSSSTSSLASLYGGAGATDIRL